MKAARAKLLRRKVGKLVADGELKQEHAGRLHRELKTNWKARNVPRALEPLTRAELLARRRAARGQRILAEVSP